MDLNAAKHSGEHDAFVKANLQETDRRMSAHGPPTADMMGQMAIHSRKDINKIRAGKIILDWIRPKAKAPLVLIQQQNVGVSRLDIPIKAEGDAKIEALEEHPPRPQIGPGPLPKTVKAPTTAKVPGTVADAEALALAPADEQVLEAEQPRQVKESGQPTKRVTW